MRKYLLGLSGLVLALGAGYLFINDYNQTSYLPTNYSHLMHATGQADYNAQFYHMMRANYKTGKIDFNDVLRARREVAQFSAQKSSTYNLSWEYMGPNFVGGRTRALHQDNQTNNSSILYAGGIAGGMFVTYNGGQKWYQINADLPDLAISCITQTSNGVLFVGQGSSHEGSGGGHPNETGHPGDGVFRREIDGLGGASYTRIVGPAIANSGTAVPWRQINQIKGHPTDENKLYVGMNNGLMVTTNPHSDAVTFFNPIKIGGGQEFTGIIDDIALNSTGSKVYVTSGPKFYILSDKGGTDVSVDSSITFSGAGRIAIGMSPTDDNYIYLAASSSTGGGCLSGIYQSRDAGKTFQLIGPAGGSFDPYSNPGVNCQGNYDNAIGVFPGDPGKIIVGGVQLWKWEQSANTPGQGGWSQIAVTTGGAFNLTDTNYVHADKHRILITTPNVIYVASDGGIGKSIDGGNTWGQFNDGFDVTTFYGVTSAVGIPFEDGQGNTILSEQVMGGTQDNGTQVVGLGFGRPMDGFRLKGGDGFSCAFSNLASLAFATSQNGDLTKQSQIAPQAEYFYDSELINDYGCPDCGPFYTRISYWEEAYVDNTFDSIKVYIHSDVDQGDTLHYFSDIGNTPMAWAAPTDLFNGDSIYLPDFAQSKLAYWLGTNNEIFMTRDAPKSNTINYEWDMIASGSFGESVPDRISGSVFRMEFTTDGAHLYLCTSNGRVFRIDNLNQGYDSLTLDVRSDRCVLTCTQIYSGSGFISSIAVDPNNNDNVAFTISGFGSTSPQVYSSTNATSLSASFTPKQGDLPNMPVYASAYSVTDAKTLLVGTEFGVYHTSDLSAPFPTWNADMGMPLVPVYQLHAQYIKYLYGENVPQSENFSYGNIYAGTCGRGFYRTSSLVGIDENNDEIASKEPGVQFKIYPNPMSETGYLSVETKGKENGVIEIFDLNGKRISTVFNGVLKGGIQNIEFNVSGFKNGTYIARLRTESEMQVSKFVVIK